MSNCETFSLPAVEAEPHQVREVLRCLLHTILFNRALGYVKPHDVDSDLLDLTYVSVGDPEAQAAIESGIQELCSALERGSRRSSQAQVRLSFYERRQKAAWFGTKDERLYWEQWLVNIAVVTRDTALQMASSMPIPGQGPAAPFAPPSGGDRLAASLAEALTYITRCVSERRDHIPPVTSSHTLTYPFDISAPTRETARSSSFSLGNVKKLLMQTSPPPMMG